MHIMWESVIQGKSPGIRSKEWTLNLSESYRSGEVKGPEGREAGH